MPAGSPFGTDHPVLAAPMAGGPTTPALVIAAAEAGSLGFLGAGYLAPDGLAELIRAVRDRTGRFGVNLFAPNPLPVDPSEFRRYAGAVQAEADRYGLLVADAEPVEDDDGWAGKLDVLLADPPPVVSFTFGIPAASVLAAFRRSGTLTVQTVTSVAEAVRAEQAGVAALAVQSRAAGGHLGTFTPRSLPPDVALPDLVAGVRAATGLPVLAAGGLADPAAVTGALAAGATAVQVGTALLRSTESGASPALRAALAEDRGAPVITRAFTGRPAGALPNRFSRRYEAIAPFGYPAIHYLTSPLRRAAAAVGDPEPVNLWAGAGYRSATEEPVAVILDRLAGGA